MKLIPLTQWAALNGVHRSRAHVLVNQGRIKGAVMLGNRWFVPQDAKRLPPNKSA
jgi:predicted site-specific integrase-resolvase